MKELRSLYPLLVSLLTTLTVSPVSVLPLKLDVAGVSVGLGLLDLAETGGCGKNAFHLQPTRGSGDPTRFLYYAVRSEQDFRQLHAMQAGLFTPDGRMLTSWPAVAQPGSGTSMQLELDMDVPRTAGVHYADHPALLVGVWCAQRDMQHGGGGGGTAWPWSPMHYGMVPLTLGPWATATPPPIISEPDMGFSAPLPLSLSSYPDSSADEEETTFGSHASKETLDHSNTLDMMYPPNRYAREDNIEDTESEDSHSAYTPSAKAAAGGYQRGLHASKHHNHRYY